MRRETSRVILYFVLILSVVLTSTVVLAQAPPAQPTKDASSVKEQTIYIPYKKLREVFEREGRVVFMPYEKFQELWRERLEKTPPPEELRPPVDSLITEITNKATVAKEVVKVESVVKIEVLKEGWNEVSLRLRDAAITRAMLEGKPARIVFEADQGYKLLVEKKGKTPQTYTLNLDFARSYTKAPGQNSVSFETPQAPVSKWEVHVGEPGVKVNIRPLIAATEVPVAEDVAETVVMAFVGAAPSVRIDWTPKAEGAKGLAALSSVKVEQQMHIEEGVTRTHVRLAYAISRAEVSTLVIEVPADQKVVNVFDPNVREWSVAAAGEVQQITVQLFEPAKTSQDLTVELQRFASNGILSVSMPVVKAVGVGRQQGIVLVRVAPGLRAEAEKRTGLLQVDASEVPGTLRRTAWQFSYRYAALPFELALSVEKIQPHIEVDSLVEVHLDPEELTLDMFAVYDVQKAGVFRLELDVPKGYEVRQVHGQATKDVSAAAVDAHHLEGTDKTHLVVNLSRKAFGKVGLALQLHMRLHEPDLLSPTGKTADVPLVIPRVTPTSVQRRSGRVIVYAPESLRVNPSNVKGLRTISFSEATDGMRSTLKGKERPVLAFAYTEEATTLTLAAERRKPHVTARQLLVASLEPGVVKYDVTLFYDILYSGVKSFRLDVPSEIAADIRIVTPGVRHQALEDAEKPKDLAEGFIAWQLTGETEFLGQVRIQLKWEEKIEKLDIGKSVSVSVPALKPMGADRAWGQIVLAKTETLDVRPEKPSPTLRPIDPQQDLMEGAKVPSAAQAFEFHEDWQLTVAATRYELQEVKRTSIDRALIRMVVTRANVTSVQAIYRMRSQRQRLHIQLPVNVSFDTEPLRIDGRPVTLEQGGTEKNIVSVPLVGQDPEKPFLLELRYTVEHAGLLFECPVFPEKPEPALQRVRLSVHVPENLAYLGRTGPWTAELRWYARRWNLVPVATVGPGRLIEWVTEGLDVDTGSLTSFETDGHHYLFTSLRPPDPPSGSLRVVALNENLLTVLVWVIVIGGGVALLWKGVVERALAAGAAAVVLVFLGVFFPSLTRQIVDGNLIAGVFIVLVGWFLWYLVWTRPRRPKDKSPGTSFVGTTWRGLTARLRRKPKASAPGDEGKTGEEAETPPSSAKRKGRTRHDKDESGEGGQSNA